MIKIIGGVIVTFNPVIQLLCHNVDVLKKQVKLVVIVDNNSIDLNLIQLRYQGDEDVIIIANEENCGIAKAMNQGFDTLYKKGFEWGVSFDQDSECPANFIQEATSCLNKSDIGIICPQVFDKNMAEYLGKCVASNTMEYVNKCISSGAITNLLIWKETGGFDEKMFIDYVDFDYATKLKLRGYKILKLSKVVMNHELGKCTYIVVFGHKIRISNHSAFRKYYMGRNIVYYIKKYRFKINIFLEILRLIKIPVFVILFEEGKVEKMHAFFKGIKEGFNLKVTNYNEDK